MMHLTDITGKPLGLKPGADNQDKLFIRHEETLSTGSNNTPAASANAPPRVRRRNRMITSCLECRRRKLKCDKSHPCTNCVKAARDCLFLAPALDSASQLKLTEIKEKMGSLERVLEQDVAKKSTKPGISKNGVIQDVGCEGIDFAPEPEDERDLETTPLALSDAAYDDDADDDLNDLGFMMGKLRLTDRVGGFFRPKMAEELTVTLNDQRNDHRSPVEKAESPDPPAPFYPVSMSHTFMGPGPTYIAPSSTFLFSHHSSSASLIDFLPSKNVADRLLDQYWKSVHPIARLVHKPSFKRRYNTFWDDVRLGIEPAGSLQAVIFAAMFSAVVSMPEDAILMEFGVSKKDLVDNFQMGTETALGRANMIRTTKIETLQAFVMYMLPLCRSEVSRSHSALCGTAIRIAECMGLHRDGTEYGLGPVETHVRRMIWYQLCFLDVRTCEAQGPRPGIREEEFDTRMPLNVDDDDLESPIPPIESATRWTDMTLSLIRWECVEMHRVVWVDRPRLEKKKISLTAVLGKVENFRRMMREKYLSLIDDSVPVQREGRLLCEVLTLRMHAMVLHKYHNSVTQTIPDRLRQIIITSGVDSMEAAIELETSPDLRPWAWYTGAHQQYHYGLLLLLEIFAFPMRKEADRIWACLDYIFEVPPHLSRDQKGRLILTEIRDKTMIYRNARKLRAPTGLVDRLGQQPARKSGTPLDTRPSVGKMQGFDPSTVEFSQDHVAGDALYSQKVDVNKVQGNTEPRYFPSNIPLPTPPVNDDRMVDIDWYEWDKLFPPHTNAATVNLPSHS